MRIKFASVYVDDQDKALKFYTEILGFVKMADISLGQYRWLTVISGENKGDLELVLEPSNNPAIKDFKNALYQQGIPLTAFAVDDVQKEYEKLKTLGVKFTVNPTKESWGSYAVFDDTCGNLINIAQSKMQ